MFGHLDASVKRGSVPRVRRFQPYLWACVVGSALNALPIHDVVIAADPSAGVMRGQHAVDVEGELEAFRNARRALASELKAFEEQLRAPVQTANQPPRETAAVQRPLAVVANSAPARLDTPLSLDDELQRARAAREDLAKELHQLTELLAVARSQQAQRSVISETALLQLKAMLEAMRSQIAEAQSARDDQAVMQQQNTRWLEQIREARNAELHALEQRLEQLFEELVASRREAESERAALQQAHAARLTDLQTELEHARTSQSQATAKLAEIEKSRQALVERMADSASTPSATQAVLETQLAAMKRDRDEALQTLAERASAVAKEQDAVVNALSQARGQLASRAAELESLKAQLEQQRKDTTMREGENEKLLAIVSDFRQQLAARDDADRADRAAAQQRQQASATASQSQREAFRGLTLELRTQLAERAEQEREFRAEMQQSQQTMSAQWQSQRKELHQLIANLREQLAAREEAQQALHGEQQRSRASTVTTWETQRTELNRLILAFQEQLAHRSALQQELEQRDTVQINALHQQVAGSDHRAKELSARVKALDEELQRRRAEESQRNQDLDQLSQLAAARAAEVQSLRERVTKAEDSHALLENLRTQYDISRTRLASMEKSLRAARSELGQVSVENTSLRNQLSTAAPTTSVESPPKAAPAVRTHVVRRGESLSLIARQYLGNAGQWRIIFDANRERLTNPNVVEPGTELVIPDN